jgi:hypothetical protein
MLRARKRCSASLDCLLALRAISPSRAISDKQFKLSEVERPALAVNRGKAVRQTAVPQPQTGPAALWLELDFD